MTSRISAFLCATILTVGLSACSGEIKKEASYPTKPEYGTKTTVYSDDKKDTIWGKGKTGADVLFGEKKEDTSGIGVNSFLWRASLDTISFMPVKSADPFGGVILTDWYENPEKQGERFKINVYILDRKLRADGIRVAVFKQQIADQGWKDAKVAAKTAHDIETTILTRARELKVAQQVQPK